MSIRSGLVIAVAALGILGAGWTTPAAAQGAGCTGSGKISKQIAKPMKAAQDAQNARKWQEELARVKEAEATPGPKTAFDLYYMSEFRHYAYHNLRQDADAAREMEVGLNSPCMPESKKLDRYKTLVGLYNSLRNYPKVIEYGNRALKMSRDLDMQVFVAQAYYQSGNSKEAARLMNEVLDQSGRVPKEQQLLLVVAACQKVNDNNCVSRAFEKLVVYFPKPEYWQNLMVALTQSDLNDLQRLNVMRLSVQVNVMKKPDQFKEMAQLALEEKLACEAQAVLEQAFTKKVFVEKRDLDVNTRLLAAAKKECTVDKAALPQNETAARSAATGDADVKVGAQYLGSGDPPKAVAAIQRGITKGNLAANLPADDPNKAQRVDEANLLLGIAHLRNNNKVEAAKAFKTVKRDPTMVRIAKLWLLNT